jgi:hypothetical protein
MVPFIDTDIYLKDLVRNLPNDKVRFMHVVHILAILKWLSELWYCLTLERIMFRSKSIMCVSLDILKADELYIKLS